MNKIFTFLNTKLIIINNAALKKQNPESLSELIINFEDLKEKFQNTQWSLFFDEEEI